METIPATSLTTNSPRYGRCPRDLLSDPEMSDRAKIVYTLLDDYADSDGKAFPARSTLGRLLGCSTDSIDRAVNQLIAAKWVSKQVRKKPDGSYASTLYTLNWSPPKGVAAPVRRGSRTGAEGVAAPVPTEGEPQEVEPQKEELLPTAVAVSDPEADAFTAFWEAWPRQVGKPAARKAFRAAAKRTKPPGDPIAPTYRTIIEGAVQYASDPNRPASLVYVPHPTTWLNRDGWRDGPLPVPDDGKPRVDRSQIGVTSSDEWAKWEQERETSKHG